MSDQGSCSVFPPFFRVHSHVANQGGQTICASPGSLLILGLFSLQYGHIPVVAQFVKGISCNFNVRNSLVKGALPVLVSFRT